MHAQKELNISHDIIKKYALLNKPYKALDYQGAPARASSLFLSRQIPVLNESIRAASGRLAFFLLSPPAVLQGGIKKRLKKNGRGDWGCCAGYIFSYERFKD
jgi:hypothetical protein